MTALSNFATHAATGTLTKPSDRLSYASRAAHDWGLASWLGGSMFGKFALNPAVRAIEDEKDRGKVVNAAWNGYNVVNAVSLTAVGLGWAGARFTEARPTHLGSTERNLATIKDALVVSSLITGLVSGVEGGRLALQGKDHALPIESGTVPSPDTPEKAARIQRVLGAAGTANIVSGVALVIVNAVMAQAAYSRPPLRRALLRRSN